MLHFEFPQGREAINWINPRLVTNSYIFLLAVYALSFWCWEHCYATCAVFSKYSGCTKHHSCSNSEEVSVYPLSPALQVKWFCRCVIVAAMLEIFVVFSGLTWSKGYMSSISQPWPLAQVLQQQMSWLRFKLWRLIIFLWPIQIYGSVIYCFISSS